MTTQTQTPPWTSVPLSAKGARISAAASTRAWRKW